MKIKAKRYEKQQNLPGDTLLPRIDRRITYAVTIDSPPSRVWPWLVQMGCDRGGWYSFDEVDNGGHPSADRIHPEWQHLEIGDHLAGSPSDAPGSGFEVSEIHPNQSLVLTSANELPGFVPVEKDKPLPKYFWKITWCFFLQPWGDRQTRLIVRNNLFLRPRWLLFPLVWLIAGPIHFLMERKQLKEIKARCERVTGKKVSPDTAGNFQPLATLVQHR